jgi:hypothetical protein
MRPLDAKMDRLALSRLRRLIEPWGGSIQVVYSMPENDDDWYPAPFAEFCRQDTLGLWWTRKRIVMCSPMSLHYVGDVIHECAHLFATTKRPDESSEWDFLGWEMVVAERVGLPMPSWRQAHYNYFVDLDTSRTIVEYTDKELRHLYEDRVMYAWLTGIIDEKGRPLSVR